MLCASSRVLSALDRAAHRNSEVRFDERRHVGHERRHGVPSTDAALLQRARQPPAARVGLAPGLPERAVTIATRSGCTAPRAPGTSTASAGRSSRRSSRGRGRRWMPCACEGRRFPSRPGASGRPRRVLNVSGCRWNDPDDAARQCVRGPGHRRARRFSAGLARLGDTAAPTRIRLDDLVRTTATHSAWLEALGHRGGSASTGSGSTPMTSWPAWPSIPSTSSSASAGARRSAADGTPSM